jgi:hypothetical protein
LYWLHYRIEKMKGVQCIHQITLHTNRLYWKMIYVGPHTIAGDYTVGDRGDRGDHGDRKGLGGIISDGCHQFIIEGDHWIHFFQINKNSRRQRPKNQ